MIRDTRSERGGVTALLLVAGLVAFGVVLLFLTGHRAEVAHDEAVHEVDRAQALIEQSVERLRDAHATHDEHADHDHDATSDDPEVAELRATRDELRAEVERLRTEIEQLQADALRDG